MASLDELTQAYPPADGRPGVVVLREYHRILEARARGWRWTEIAASLDLASGPLLAAAWRRLEKKIQAGALSPPASVKVPTAAGVPRDSPIPATAKPAGTGHRTPSAGVPLERPETDKERLAKLGITFK